MPFLEHLEELRWRLLKMIGSVILFTIIAFPFTSQLLHILELPNLNLSEPAKVIYVKPTGMLMVRMEIGIVTGIILSLPVILYQFWQFIAPGLLKKEKRFFLPTLFLTTFCFLSGTAFAYFVLIPTVLPFLYKMGTDSIQANYIISEYISFVLRLILVAGLIFELPILSFFLARIGILSPSFLKKYRRYGIVLVFILSALITPPDPFSQILMAFPLLILYQISIWVARLGQKKRNASDIASEEDKSTKNKSKQKK